MKIFEDNYNELGNSSQNLILKTRGKVKIQWGKKFIDLIDNDGNIANTFKIKKIQDVSNIVQEGIYIKDDILYIKVNGKSPIEINSSELSTNYVSYENQEIQVSSEQKLNALRNIGYYYKNIDDIPEDFEGLVYIENEKALYLISASSKDIFSINIPNPYQKQFKINKNTSERGALVINGKGLDNGIILDNLSIYIDYDNNIIYNSNSEQIFSISSNPVLKLSNDGIQVNSISSFNDGFSLIDNNGKYILIIDHLIEKSKDIIDTYYLNSGLNIIESIDLEEDNYLLHLKYPKSYSQNQILFLYGENIKFPLTVLEDVQNSNIVKVSSQFILNIEDFQYCLCFENNTSGVIIGKISENDFGIISQNNIFYKTEFEDFPKYSQTLYSSIQGELDDRTLVPYGIFKNIINNLNSEINSLKERIDNLEGNTSN